MGRIKVYTDEDADIAVSKALRLRGLEASTTLEHERCKNSDNEQLEYASSIEVVVGQAVVLTITQPLEKIL